MTIQLLCGPLTPTMCSWLPSRAISLGGALATPPNAAPILFAVARLQFVLQAPTSHTFLPHASSRPSLQPSRTPVLPALRTVSAGARPRRTFLPHADTTAKKCINSCCCPGLLYSVFVGLFCHVERSLLIACVQQLQPVIVAGRDRLSQGTFFLWRLRRLRRRGPDAWRATSKFTD